MNDFVVAFMFTALNVAVGFLSYALGKRKERNEVFKEKEKAVAEARRLRNSLRDDAVRDRLHDRFKR